MFEELYIHIHKSLNTQSTIKVFLDDTAVIKYSVITLTWIRCRILYKISCHPFLKIFVNLILNVCSFINTCINVSSLVTEPLYLEEDIIKMFWHRKVKLYLFLVPEESVKHVGYIDKHTPLSRALTSQVTQLLFISKHSLYTYPNCDLLCN